MRSIKWGKPDSVVLEGLLALAAVAIAVFGLGPLLLGAAGIGVGTGPTSGREIVVPLVALAVIAYLLRIVRTLRRGDPFVPENARRLTAIALLIAVGGTVGNLVHQIAIDSLVQGSAASGIVAHVFDVSFLPIVIGTAAAFLAEVFRRGARLREDVEGLV